MAQWVYLGVEGTVRLHRNGTDKGIAVTHHFNYTISLKLQSISIYNNYLSILPKAGLEPARPYEQGILSPLCLPIPPFRPIDIL